MLMPLYSFYRMVGKVPHGGCHGMLLGKESLEEWGELCSHGASGSMGDINGREVRKKEREHREEERQR